MALADIGEDTVVSCSDCSYAANLERAESAASAEPAGRESVKTDGSSVIERVITPNVKSIQELTDFLQVGGAIDQDADLPRGRRTGCGACPGDRRSKRGKGEVLPRSRTRGISERRRGDAGDGSPSRVCGTGRSNPEGIGRFRSSSYGRGSPVLTRGYPSEGVRPGHDFSLEHTGDFRNVTEGEPCPRCGAPLQFHRGIELGHVFKLGTKYSEAMNAMYLDSDGREKPLIMGCYGIGVSRVMSAIAEQCISDERLVWPMSVAPFKVHIIPVAVKDEIQMKLAEHIYSELNKAGLEPLLDDRDERAGVKFKDADLAGAPLRLIVGRGAANGEVEWMGQDGIKITLPAEEAVQRTREEAVRQLDGAFQ